MPNTTTPPMRAARIGARITPDVLNAVRRAAEIEGRSVSDFIVDAARIAAERTIQRTQILQFSLADQERIADILCKPARMTDALARAEAVYGELIRESR